jgi:chitin disaccharide deacetylase
VAISTNSISVAAENSYSQTPTTLRDVDTPRMNALIVNADDWGCDRNTTDRILDCRLRGALFSASAMVFMSDSERAAELARERGVDVGLHLNFTETFSGPIGYVHLAEHHARVADFLLRNRFSQVVYHPRLTSSFEYLVRAQLDEFRRIYGFAPERIDGHHHMHLCANVLYGKLLPEGTRVRRNFSFWPHEKGTVNRLYRHFIDSRLATRHVLADFLFSLPPLDPKARLQRIFAAARGAVVELETHPVNADEYAFLTNGEMLRQTGDVLLPGGFAALRKVTSPLS